MAILPAHALHSLIAQTCSASSVSLLVQALVLQLWLHAGGVPAVTTMHAWMWL